MSDKEIISLNIETSTTLCSVSIGVNENCLDTIEINDGKYHSEQLHYFIKELLQKTSVAISDISVIAISSGPGSYTGLRIGAASAKTLAYALNVPLVAISSLHTQALEFIEQKSNNHQYIASTMQARGKKIYLGIYSYEGREMLFPETFILSDENIHSLKEKYKDIIFIGSGYSDIVSEDNIIYPSSRYMIKETFSKYQNNEFVSTVYFEPMYI